MLIDHTAHTPAVEQQIEELVGTSFSLLTKLQMKGTGSEKMQILSCSAYFKKVLNQHQEINYGSIEIRTEGIILHFNNGKNYYVWCIPYYRLAVYRTDMLSIHGEGHVVKFKCEKQKNKSFIRTLLHQIARYQERFYFGPF